MPQQIKIQNKLKDGLTVNRPSRGFETIIFKSKTTTLFSPSGCHMKLSALNKHMY